MTVCNNEKPMQKSKMILTNENYYTSEANKHYMSVSQYKDFLQCEACALAKLKGEYQMPMTTALLVGSYVDSYFEGTLDEFKNNHPEILKRDGTLKADYVQADKIIERVNKDKQFMKLMSGEKQKIFTAEMFGCDWKIKIDSLLPDMIVDLKCMRQLEPIMGVNFITHWKYDYQLAVYQEIYYRCTGKRLDTAIAVCTKENVTNIDWVKMPQWRLDECLEDIKKQMPHILAVKKGEYPAYSCGVCDYCKENKVLTDEPTDFEQIGFRNEII